MVHAGNVAASTRALCILFHFVKAADQAVVAGRRGRAPPSKKPLAPGEAEGEAAGRLDSAKLADRFYRALYAKLGGGGMLASSKPTLFLNLLFKVLNPSCFGRVPVSLCRLSF
jgi:predicted ribosome quality control (RQC) complex YloA/Tae2 family protein